MREEIIARAGEIIARKTGGGNEGYCVLALIDTDGYPTACIDGSALRKRQRYGTVMVEWKPPQYC